MSRIISDSETVKRHVSLMEDGADTMTKESEA